MRTHIKQDFTITWLPMYVLMAIGDSCIIFAACMAHGMQRLFFIATAIALPLLTRSLLHGSRRDMEAGPQWFITDDGLTHEGSDDGSHKNPPYTIAWPQIRDLKYGPGNGLIVRWTPSSPADAPRARRLHPVKKHWIDDPYRITLRLREPAARNVIRIWHKATGATSAGDNETVTDNGASKINS
jgi:hypothetical protein